MADVPIENYRAYGGDRILLPISLRDAGGSLGFVKALIDTGAPNTMLFINVLKRFRRLKPASLSPPQYSNIAGFVFERKTLGKLSINLRDSAGNMVEFKQEVFAAANANEQAGANPFEMIIGLDFLAANKAVINFKEPGKPVLQIEEQKE
ncbi:hypothetical protein AUJ17_01065 [Candidatus Micrarchaeota archaeon CG1_02_47_40]|nr:MAG: hypothetical protein AUJ17_01065 [Candidatus Micrarchaeota archaeon CG1_02_47_40]